MCLVELCEVLVECVVFDEEFVLLCELLVEVEMKEKVFVDCVKWFFLW